MEIILNFNKEIVKSKTNIKKSNHISINDKGKKINNKLNNSFQTKDGDCPIKELESLIGLNEVKILIKELRAYVLVQKARSREKLANETMTLHMIFKGNPGTGKTTVARIVGKFFKEMGILSKGHLVEVERADLVGEYIGHTAARARDSIKKALGGILFVDEAYSLARGGDKDFGREAIDCLVKGMEDHRDNIILILAGYKNEMEKLIRTNPGLRSRFPIHIDFPDYSSEELFEIAEKMFLDREYYLSIDARIRLEAIIKRLIASGQASLGNARIIRNLVEKSIRKQAYRLVEENNFSREELLMIKAEDLSNEFENILGIDINQLKKVK